MSRLLHLYVVRDVRANTLIGPIVHATSVVPLTRQITDAINKGDNLIANNPEDFEIHWVGQIDEETGQIHVELEDGNDAIGVTSVQVRALALRAQPQ